MKCINHLRVEGAKEDVERFVSQLQADDGDFLHSFIPTPHEYGQVTVYSGREWDKEIYALLVLKYGAGNLCEWRLSNWGAEEEDGDLSYDEQTHSFNFTTDRPPVIAIIRISILYPDLKIFFEYKTDEESSDKVLGKWGKYVIHGGWIEHEQYENQEKGNLAKWIEIIREDNKELKTECLQRAGEYEKRS